MPELFLWFIQIQTIGHTTIQISRLATTAGAATATANATVTTTTTATTTMASAAIIATFIS